MLFTIYEEDDSPSTSTQLFTIYEEDDEMDYNVQLLVTSKRKRRHDEKDAPPTKKIRADESIHELTLQLLKNKLS